MIGDATSTVEEAVPLSIDIVGGGAAGDVEERELAFVLRVFQSDKPMARRLLVGKGVNVGSGVGPGESVSESAAVSVPQSAFCSVAGLFVGSLVLCARESGRQYTVRPPHSK